MSGSRTPGETGNGRRGRSDLHQLIVDTLGSAHGERIFTALQDAGYETKADIRDAHPMVVKKINDVGRGTLRALTEEIDDFEVRNCTSDPSDAVEREYVPVTHCPVCRDELVDGEYLSHILNCDDSA